MKVIDRFSNAKLRHQFVYYDIYIYNINFDKKLRSNHRFIICEKDFKEFITMIGEKYEVECEYADKLKKIYTRNFSFSSESEGRGEKKDRAGVCYHSF